MSFVDFFNKNFPIPEYLDMPHVGIDIGYSSIHLVCLKRKFRGCKLVFFERLPLAIPFVSKEGLLSNQGLVDSLKKLQKQHSLNFVEVSIPEERSYLFTMEVPAGDNRSIRNNIELHLEENVPIPIDNAVFDYHVVKHNLANDTLLVAVSVIPATLVDEYITLFEYCGMTPVSFLIENQALVKAVIPKENLGGLMMANFGKTKTVLSIVTDEAIQFTSTVNIGSDDFTNAIKKQFNIETSEAEKIKFEKGFSRDKDNEQVLLALINSASALKDEIDKLFVYWRSVGERGASYAPSLDKIIIAGREAGVPGLKEYLAVSLKMPVEVANVWTNVSAFKDDVPAITLKESLSFGTAIGLALPKLRYDEINFKKLISKKGDRKTS